MFNLGEFRLSLYSFEIMANKKKLKVGEGFKSSLGEIGRGFVGASLNSLGSGLMSAMFGGIANRRARDMYRFQKEQDLKYQKELSEYLTTNQSAWQKQSLRNAGLSTAGMEGSTTLAGTSLGSGNLQSQPIDPGQFALGEVAASLADAARADSQARLYDKQVRWFDRQAQTDIDLKSSQIGLNDESRRVQIALGEKYTAERLNMEAARAGIQAQSELARDMIKSQIGVNDANANKLAKEAELEAKNIATYDQRLKFELDKWAAETKASLGQAAAAFATISVCKAQARLMGSQADRIDKMTPQELRKLVQDTAHVTQMVQNAKTDRDMTMARLEFQKYENKYYVKNMRWNHASQAFGMVRDAGIGVGSVMSGAGSMMSGGAAMGNYNLNYNNAAALSAPRNPVGFR